MLCKSEKIGAASVIKVIHRATGVKLNCNAAALQCECSHSPFPVGELNTGGKRKGETQWRIEVGAWEG